MQTIDYFLVYMAINRHYVTNFIHIFVEIITVDNVDKSVDSLYMGIICSHFVHISSTLLYYGNFAFVSFCIMCPEQYFGKKLYDTVIPRNVRLAEAPAHGLPVIYFEKSSKGAVAYLNLAAEIVKKIKKGSPA